MDIQHSKFSRALPEAAKSRSPWFTVRRFTLVVLAAMFALVLVPVESRSPVTEAVAQEKKRGFRLLDRLFRPKQARRQQHKEIRVRKQRPAAKRSTKRRATQQRANRNTARRTTAHRQAPARRQAVTVNKNDDARVVLVIGDFLAAGLARGMTQSYAENPTVIVVDRSMPSSGLVRDDHYDWQANAKEMLEAEKRIDLVSIIVGANDSQPIRSGGKPAMATRSDEWVAAYKERARALSAIFTERNIPVVWSSVPPMQKNSLTATITAINGYQTEVAAENPLVSHVDIWDGFADENGKYVATGPDEKGQVRRLRTSDGINLSSAGRTKIAFYVKQVVDQVLGDGPTAFAALQTAPTGAALAGADAGVRPVRPEVWEVVLSDEASPNGGLAGAKAIVPELTARPNDTEAEIAQKRLRDGLPPLARKGRVDDFSTNTVQDLPRL